jgi:tol-pal system protein YbgF
MRRELRRGVLVAAAAAGLGGCVSTEDIDGLRSQVAEVQRQVLQIQTQGSSKQEVAELEQSIADKMTSLLKSEADMQVELRNLTTEINALEAKLEDTNYRLAQLSQQIAATNQKLDGFRLAAVADPAAGGAPPLAGGGDDPTTLYQNAYNDYLRGNYELAVAGFRRYLEQFPDTELTDNAAYWIGECSFSQKKYAQAIREFDEVLTRFPKSDKLASALLKKAYAHIEAGDRTRGGALLQQVVRDYPSTDEANLARQRLTNLQR